MPIEIRDSDYVFQELVDSCLILDGGSVLDLLEFDGDLGLGVFGGTKIDRGFAFADFVLGSVLVVEGQLEFLHKGRSKFYLLYFNNQKNLHETK